MHHRLQVLCEYYIQYNSDNDFFPNSNAKHRFRSVNFPENKKRLLLYHYLQGKGLLIDRNSTAFSSY